MVGVLEESDRQEWCKYKYTHTWNSQKNFKIVKRFLQKQTLADSTLGISRDKKVSFLHRPSWEPKASVIELFSGS